MQQAVLFHGKTKKNNDEKWRMFRWTVILVITFL